MTEYIGFLYSAVSVSVSTLGSSTGAGRRVLLLTLFALFTDRLAAELEVIVRKLDRFASFHGFGTVL